MCKERTVIDFRHRKFIQVSRDIIDMDKYLTKSVDLAVYVVLCMYADNTTKDASPSVSTIAKKARCSERVARRSLATLESAGYIEILKRFSPRGYQTSNQYFLLDVNFKEENVGVSESEGQGVTKKTGQGCQKG